MKHCIGFLIFLILQSSFGWALEDADFSPISDVPQDVTKLRTVVKCPRSGRHPKAFVTVLPSSSDSNSVEVLTYPANLVTVSDDNGELQLDWNFDVASDSSIKEAGIKVLFPESQLNEVHVTSDSKAQILAGFSSMTALKISSDARLWANFTSVTGSTSLPQMSDITASSDAEAAIYTDTSGISNVRVSSDAVLKLEAPSATIETLKVSSDAEALLKVAAVQESVQISSDAKLSIEGDLIGSTKISSDGVVNVYGSHSITGEVSLSSDGRLYVSKDSTLSASVSARSDARIYAPTCENVSTSSDGRCYVDTTIDGSVVVSVPLQPLTSTGSSRCPIFIFNGVDSPWSIAGSVLFLVLLVAGCCFCCRKCCCGRKRSSRDFVGMPPSMVADFDGIQQSTEKSQDKMGLASNGSQVVEATVLGYEDASTVDVSLDPEKQVPLKHMS